MKRPIIFFGYPVHGHTNPTLPFFEKLVQHGENVICFSAESYRSVYEELHIPFQPYYDDVIAFGSIDNGYLGVVNALWEKAEMVIKEHFSMIKKLNPSLIIYDNCAAWGNLIASKLGINSICSVTAGFSKTRERDIPRYRRISEYLKSGEIMKYLKVERLRKRLNRKYNADLNIDTAFISYRPSNLIYTARAFYPGEEFNNQRNYFIGLLYPFKRVRKVDYYADAAAYDKVIYISFGSAASFSSVVCRKFIDTYKDSPYLVFISIWKSFDRQLLGDIPSNIIIEDFLPQVEILSFSDLFITHCGMNSTQEAIYQGVPLFMCPQVGDQPAISRRVEKLGNGIIIGEDITSDALKEKTEWFFHEQTELTEKAKALSLAYEEGESDLERFLCDLDKLKNQ